MAILLGIAGGALDVARFGLGEGSATLRLERDVRSSLSRRAERVEALAARVTSDPKPIVDAITSRDALPALFATLATLAESDEVEPVTVTVYVPERPGSFRVLAWSDGPAGDVAADFLDGPAALFVARGSAGLRLVFVQPLDISERRVAVAVAETVLAPVGPSGAALFPTAYGAVTLVPPPYAGATPVAASDGFVIPTPTGAGALVEVRYAPADPAATQRQFRRRALAVAAVPIALALLVAVGPLLDRRRRSLNGRSWIGWSTCAVLAVALSASSLAALAAFAELPQGVVSPVLAAGVVAIVAILPGGWWWRRGPRLLLARHPARFVGEHLAAGAGLAATVTGIALLLSRRVTPDLLFSWRSALFPLDAAGLVGIWSTLLLALGLSWAVAAVFGGLASRWRLPNDGRATVLAVACWLTPLALVLVPSSSWAQPPASAAVFAAAVLVVFTVGATRLRRYYRRTTQSMRLLLGFAALVVPLVTIYPMAAILVDRATRTVIEQEFAPLTAGQSDEIRAVLLQTQDEIDRLSSLAAQVRSRIGQPVDSQTAFAVWTETSLSRTRVISDIELYGPDRALISRFTLNFPDYLYRASTRTWQGSVDEARQCEWQVSGDVTRFGAGDRAMLHATRGLCDATGGFAGAVVLHVAPTDYRALPFVASPSPYGAVFGMDVTPAQPGLPGLQVVVYGWSLQPLFTSSGIAWSLDVPLFNRLYRDGTPFWATRQAEGRVYHVHFVQNRAGIYALGYPAPTPFEHGARLAEILAVTSVLFILIQIGAVAYAPLARRPDPPLRVLLHEIRTSFYRKLFLFFVLVAVGPVFLFALAFGAYMTTKFRADVEAEAETVVTAARRVFEQVAAAEEPPGQRLVPLTDDLMVWIRQLIDQDVNLFDGSELVATSQRDLYNSGLLPTRTPAVLYRRIALERLPTFVAEDRQYLAAASPLPARGPDAVLSVPLASRQREIEAEIDELFRGVLVGSVFVVLFAAGLGAWLASRVADPVARLTAATRQIAAGRLDVRIAADTADELRRLVDDFNTMTATLVAQRAALARTNQLKAWNEMARQVAHEIKNPLTPIQLAAEHLLRVHGDRGRPLGAIFDQCMDAILGQVRLLRRIASDFANFAAEPTPRPEPVDLAALLDEVVGPYALGLTGRVRVELDVAPGLPLVVLDRTLLARAVTNLVENAIQAMPLGGSLTITARAASGRLVLAVADTGAGMDAETAARAFDPYFSTKTGGSGLGLANAKRSIELEGGTIAIASTPGAGTTVTISLPAAPPGAPGGASAPSR